jgi:YHS domain-containing protein
MNIWLISIRLAALPALLLLGMAAMAAESGPMQNVCTVCLAMDGNDTPMNVAVTASHGGQDHTFCTVEHRALFVENPEFYIGLTSPPEEDFVTALPA